MHQNNEWKCDKKSQTNRIQSFTPQLWLGLEALLPVTKNKPPNRVIRTQQQHFPKQAPNQSDERTRNFRPVRLDG